MLNDRSRRAQEHVRHKEAGTYEEILSLRKFEEEYDTAHPEVQRAVREMISTKALISC